ncbi:MAG: hypothetical protein ACK5KP_11160 [Paludibacteraceae bacterium]
MTKEISKRYYTACIALQGLLANEKIISELSGVKATWIAKSAFRIADEMIKTENL